MNEFEMVDVKKLLPNPLREKARTIPDKERGRYLLIRDSIRANGIKSPILVQKNTNLIIGGHTRYEIALELHLDQVPVRFVDVDDAAATYMFLEDNLDHAEDEKDPMKIAWQCQELKKLIGREQGRPRKSDEDETLLQADIANKLNMSQAMFKRYVSLNDLIPELQALVSAGKVGIMSGAELSRLSHENQNLVYDSIRDMSQRKEYRMTEQEAKSFRAAFENDERVQNTSYPDQTGIISGNNVSVSINTAEIIEEDIYERQSLKKQDSDMGLQLLDTPREVNAEFLDVIHDVAVHGEIEPQDNEAAVLDVNKTMNEKLTAVRGISDSNVRRTYLIQKAKAVLRNHRLEAKRAENDILSELALLLPEHYDESIIESVEELSRIYRRLSDTMARILQRIHG